MTNPHKILEAAIEAKIAASSDAWKNSRFLGMRHIQIDSRGEVGEVFMRDVLKSLGHHVEVDRTTDPTEKHWDLKVDGSVTLEVKTATMGAGKRPMFQHEHVLKDKKYDGLALVDIAPNDIYLTMAPKDTLPFLKENNIWTRNPKKMHRRMHGVEYKWDLSLKDVEGRKIETLDDIRRAYEKLARHVGKL